MSDDARQLGSEVAALCQGMGFALAGVSAARGTDHREELLAWLEAGKHGSMGWLARNVEERMDPGRVLAGAKSVVMVGDVYAATGAAEPPLSSKTPTSPPPPRNGAGERGKIARYARGDDYHEVIKQRLHALCDSLRARYPSEEFRAFVDTAPVLEREHAVRAGLGWIGKHTLLIHPQLGSWMLLGGVLTTLELAPPEEQHAITDHCGTCTRCIDACPTKAITPYSVDARRCISYLTIERREAIPEEFHGAIGEWLFGCDVCQEVCPHNREQPRNPDRKEGGFTPQPAYTPRHDSFDLLEVLGWSEDDRRAALARSAMKRAKLEMWKRNALIVAGNVMRKSTASRTGRRGDPRQPPSSELRQRVQEIARDEGECEMVRETASAVLRTSRS